MAGSIVKFLRLVVVVSCLSSCTIGTPEQLPVSSKTATSAGGGAGGGGESESSFESLRARVDDLQRQGHLVGVVVIDGSGVEQFGNLSEGPAWSTAKVPLASAVLKGEQFGDSAALIDAAIRTSDNSAADAMWNLLGTPDEAALKVEQVIHDSGDDRTHVLAEQVRPEFSAVGQTTWSLVDQAKFLKGWRCKPQARPVLAAMRDVAPEHRFGLGHIDRAAIKGGWGPNLEGQYLVRQMAIVPQGSSDIVVTMAAQAGDGSYETGVTLLDGLSNGIQESSWKPVPGCNE